MTVELAVRGYLKSVQQFKRLLSIEEADLNQALPKLATEHAIAMRRNELDMIEIEFLDDPGPDRYFRFGTNPDGMVIPIAFPGKTRTVQ